MMKISQSQQNGAVVEILPGKDPLNHTEKTYTPLVIKPKTGWRRYGGIIFGALASLFFSISILTVKLLGRYHPLVISVWRFMGILVPSIPVLAYFQWKQPKGVLVTVWPLKEREKIINFAALQIRGFITFGMVLLSFYALKYLSVADLAVISYSGPVFVMFLAYFLLDEKCGVVPILVALLTCGGVCIIVRPPIITGAEAFDDVTLTGVGFGLGSMICNSLVVILVRRTRKVHFSLNLLVGGTWGVTESLIIASIFGVLEFPEGTRDLLLAYGVLPVCSFLFQFCIIIALKFDCAGPVSLVRAFDVIFAFLWQLLFLGVHPDAFSLTGAGVIVFGVMVLTLWKWLINLSPDKQTNSWYRFLLR